MLFDADWVSRAGIRRCTMLRTTDARRWRLRWSRRARMCTARTPMGTAFGLDREHPSLVGAQCGADSRTVLRECLFGCAAIQLCTMRPKEATRRRWWCWSRLVWTSCTVRIMMGTASGWPTIIMRAFGSLAGMCGIPLVGVLQGSFCLCSNTALHLASKCGRTSLG